MNTSSPIRVILVDDHLLFRIGLRSAFEGMDSPVTIVAEADSFASFFELLPQTQADLVLLDINLPDVSGVEIARNSPNITFTQRESEIIEMCAHGKSGKEIAAELNVSLKTVEAHKNNIFKKMGISSSVELVRYALKYGIISL